MVTCGDPTWQKNALCRIVEVVGSPLASQESTLGAISGLVVVLAQSEDKKICNHAKTVLSQMASQVKFLAPSVRSGGVPVLVPFLNGSSPSICAHTLDEMLNEPSQEGSREKAFMNAGGIRPLISVLTFGTSTCKGKAAELILDMAEHSSEFCEVAIRDGVIKPLVGLLAVEDTQCRYMRHLTNSLTFNSKEFVLFFLVHVLKGPSACLSQLKLFTVVVLFVY